MSASAPRIGKYQILDEIGRGGFATVYKAEDLRLGRLIALKLLHPQLLVDRFLVDRFFREARTLANLRHPHIVSIHEIGEAEGRVFIAMDLAADGSLADRITQGGRMSWEAALAALTPIAQALDYAHERGLVHCDLKPANILIDGGRLLLSDFGFARIASESVGSISASSSILGTPGYIPPEIWEYGAVTPAGDRYALACVAYELITGEELFKGVTPLQAMRAHARGPQFPEQWPDSVPPGVAAVLSRALAREPAERFPSAAAFLEALKALPPAAPAPLPQDNTRGRPPVQPPLAWALLIGGLLGLCGLGNLLPTVIPSLSEPTASPAAGATTPGPAGDETLRILYWQAVTILNPHLASGTKDFDGATLVLEPLARYSDKDELVPYLAAEIPTVENGGVAPDGSSITWKLVDTTWSDGTPFSAEDVVFTWEYCADSATACTTASNFELISSVEALDARTVRISWSSPNPNPYRSFVGSNGMILQKTQFASCVGAAAISDAACQAANLAPIGTGPFVVGEMRPGDKVLYNRNLAYRNNRGVYFDQVELIGGGDATSAARAVCETGEVDYAWNLQVPKAVLEPILAAGRCDAVAGGSLGVERLVVNFANPDPTLSDQRSEPDQPHPFLTDPAVRQALSLAIDRQAIAEQLYGISGEPTCNLLVAPAEFNSPNTTCERDPAQANKLLDDAGYALVDGVREKDGRPLVLELQTSINTVRQGTQAIIKANLAEIGITLNLKAIDAGVFFGVDPANPDTLNKFYSDLQMYTNSPESPDAVDYLVNWRCDKRNSSVNQWNGGNDGRYCSTEYDALIEQFTAEFDPAKRAALAIQLNDLLVNDHALIPLVNRRTPAAKSKDLQGPTHTSFDSVLWNIHTWSRR